MELAQNALVKVESVAGKLPVRPIGESREANALSGTIRELVKSVTADKINQFNGSLYRMYETRLGIRMVRAEERLTAVGADAEAAQQLRLQVGTPLLRIERVSFTYGDQPMEWRLGLCLTDNHHYLNHLE